MPEKAIVALSTAPDGKTAARLAAMLVERRLAACVNLVDGVRSLYWWDGKVHDDAEVLMICKTDASRLGALTAAIEGEHPYDCPEVIAFEISGGSQAYLDWIGAALDRD